MLNLNPFTENRFIKALKTKYLTFIYEQALQCTRSARRCRNDVGDLVRVLDEAA